MPLPNEILAGRFQRYLQRLFHIQALPPSPQLAEEVMPVMQLEALGPEHQYLADVRLCAVAFDMAATALKRQVVRIRNPAASGTVVILDEVHFSSESATVFQIGMGLASSDLAQLPGVPGKVIRDSRTTAVPTAHVTWDADPPGILGVNVFTAIIPANDFRSARPQLVLIPGYAADLQISVLNIVARFTLFWRERSILEMELAG